MQELLQELPKVAVVIDTAEEVDRGILLGILRYAKLHGPWWVRVFPKESKGHQLVELNQWKGNGIIAQIVTDSLASNLLEMNLPLITIDLLDPFLEDDHPLSTYPELRGNSEKIGIMAAEFFLERRFKNFAYVCECQNANWSQRREKSFVSRLKESGFSSHLYRSHRKRHRNPWWMDLKSLGKWLLSLPKPIAIFAANDTHACQVLDACQSTGIRIPREVSLLGVDNDQIRCETAEPSLTSIARNYIDGGYHAAKYLDFMLRTKTMEKRIISIEPIRIVQRQSTSVMNIDDPLVLKAVSFIQINSGLRMDVNHVARHLDVGRRLLELRFKAALGSTVHAEIERIRMEKVKTLLLETDMTIREISHLCSFSSEMYLANSFKKKTGITMGEYRKNFSVMSSER